jgi:hypothetical protein
VRVRAWLYKGGPIVSLVDIEIGKCVRGDIGKVTKMERTYWYSRQRYLQFESRTQQECCRNERYMESCAIGPFFCSELRFI